jgi:hypothetical protein
MKKVVITALVLLTVASFSWAAERIDTSASPQITTQQNSTSNKNLSKQTNVRRQPKSNWAKLKDMFM